MTAKKTARFTTKAAKKPQDHKTADDVVFEIETSEGLLRLPKAKLPAGILFGDEELTEPQVIRELLNHNADAEARAILNKLDAFGEDSEFAEVITYWQEASGLNVGESSASAQ